MPKIVKTKIELKLVVTTARWRTLRVASGRRPMADSLVRGRFRPEEGSHRAAALVVYASSPRYRRIELGLGTKRSNRESGVKPHVRIAFERRRGIPWKWHAPASVRSRIGGTSALRRRRAPVCARPMRLHPRRPVRWPSISTTYAGSTFVPRERRHPWFTEGREQGGQHKPISAGRSFSAPRGLSHFSAFWFGAGRFALPMAGWLFWINFSPVRRRWLLLLKADPALVRRRLQARCGEKGQARSASSFAMFWCIVRVSRSIIVSLVACGGHVLLGNVLSSSDMVMFSVSENSFTASTVQIDPIRK